MGLSYCPTPGEPDKDELREDLNRFHRDLRRKAFGGNKNIKQSIPTESISSDDELDEVVYDSGLAPFKHYKFKPKSNWNPVGPKVLEEFIVRLSRTMRLFLLSLEWTL